MHPKVAIIVVNYNGYTHLKYSIPTLLGLDYDNFDLLVIDNGSSDCSLDYLKKNGSKIKLIKLAENRFWGGGNNIAIVEALKYGAEYVLLANNDIIVDNRLLKYGVEELINNPTIAILGFATVGEYAPASVKYFYLKSKAWQVPKISFTKHIGGCLMLVRTKLFKQIGMFDEGYRFYGEEDDLERRAIWAGYKLARCNLPAWHHGEGTISTAKGLEKSLLAMTSQIRFYLKEKSIVFAITRIIKFINIICNPFVKINRKYFHNARVRPSNVFINFTLVLRALINNLKNISDIRIATHKDQQRIINGK